VLGMGSGLRGPVSVRSHTARPAVGRPLRTANGNGVTAGLESLWHAGIVCVRRNGRTQCASTDDNDTANGNGVTAARHRGYVQKASVALGKPLRTGLRAFLRPTSSAESALLNITRVRALQGNGDRRGKRTTGWDDQAIVEAEMDEVPEPTKTDEAKGSAGLQMTVAAIVISAFLFAGKAAGYVRDMIISGYFGGSAASDAFYMIYNNIVVMVYTKVEKLLRPTYLPQFVKKLKDDEPGAWRIASIMTNIQLAALLVIVVLLEVFAGQLVRRLWPNLSSDPASFTLTVGLLRIMVPALLLYSVSVMPELTLHSYKRFTVPALADCVNRVVMVALLFVGLEYLWHPDDPHAMYAAGVGVLVAYPLRFLVQLPALWAKLRHYVVSLDMSNPGVRTIFRLAEQLREEGYRFVTVDELLQKYAK